MISIPENSDFSLHNLPYGIFSTPGTAPRAGVAIGNHILDLHALALCGVFDFDPSILAQPFLNDFIALGKTTTNQVRHYMQKELKNPNADHYKNKTLWITQTEATLHLPVKIGDYTDFYSSIEHATNVGKMFRNPDKALLPNWKHIPVGYHGRASSIVVSGENIRRPKGQILPKGEDQPIFSPTQQLDFELEMGFVIGKENTLGTAITTEKAEDYIFGLVLFNDWSARDIQKWEYVPLGPFLSKSFASSMAPWIVPLEALAPFRVQGPKQNPEVLPYLQYNGPKNYDIQLEVGISPEGDSETTVCRTNYKSLYWNMAQQLAHHTVNGCSVRVGDLMASGTLSGASETAYGSMLELAWAGTKPLPMAGGSYRVFIEDGDTVTLRGRAEKDGIRVGFGSVQTKILPSL